MTLRAYYNENDAFAAAWLRELIKDGLLPDGYVDERDIRDVRAADLAGFTERHFFAGIGGWPLALRLAGWPEDRPVWTGSCPCQPFSQAGQRKGIDDPRHLWPEFHRLIAECRPAIVFGEQVASKDGRVWLAGVRADLEALGYGVGAADLCAASVSAPHIRQRLYWMANTDMPCKYERTSSRQQSLRDFGNTSTERLGDAASSGLQREWSEYRPSGERHSGLVGLAVQVGVPEWNGPAVAIQCSDGPRRVSAKSDSFPLAHGVSGRLGRLRGYGNAIVPQVAAEFIGAYLDAA